MVQTALKLALVPIFDLSMNAMKETVKHHIIKFRKLKNISQIFFRLFIFIMEATQAFRKLMTTSLPDEVKYSKNTTDKIF